MQVWYLVIGIGTLLVFTAFINNIAEAIERRKQQRMLQILRLKRCVDELSDYFDQLKKFNLTSEIKELLQEEILVRLQMIQSLDKSFHGIDELIQASASGDEQDNNTEEENEQVNTELTEIEFQDKITILRNLTKFIQTLPLKAQKTSMSKIDYYDELVAFRFEKINLFYTKKIQHAIETQEFKIAIDYLNQITGTIALAGHQSSRLIVIKDQAALLMEKINKQKQEYDEQQEAKAAMEDESLEENNDSKDKNESDH